MEVALVSRWTCDYGFTQWELGLRSVSFYILDRGSGGGMANSPHASSSHKGALTWCWACITIAGLSSMLYRVIMAVTINRAYHIHACGVAPHGWPHGVILHTHPRVRHQGCGYKGWPSLTSLNVFFFHVILSCTFHCLFFTSIAHCLLPLFISMFPYLRPLLPACSSLLFNVPVFLCLFIFCKPFLTLTCKPINIRIPQSTLQRRH